MSAHLREERGEGGNVPSYTQTGARLWSGVMLDKGVQEKEGGTVTGKEKPWLGGKPRDDASTSGQM
jgi:hypothetical protein